MCPAMCGARTHDTDPQATLQVPHNTAWNSAMCELLCHASHHDTLIVPHVPNWSCMTREMQGSLLTLLGFWLQKIFLEGYNRSTVSLPPEARCGDTQLRLFLSLLSWWLEVSWIRRVLRGPSSTPRGLWLVVEESKVQPGLLALQMVGHVGGNGVIPEADDLDARPLRQPLS